MLRTNAVTEFGRGAPPLVLLHGFGADQTTWRRLVPRLSAAHRVVTYDHMGCGRSDIGQYDPERYRTLEGYADDLVEILETLELSDALVVGHSVSGMIGLLASLRTDRIGRLVMLGSSPRYLNDAGYEGGFEAKDVDELLALMELDFQGWARALAPRALGQPDRPDLAEELTYSFSRQDAEVMRRLGRATFLSDNRAILGRCRVPTLVLQSSADVIVPLSAAQFLAKALPQARLEVLSARGHYPHIVAPGEVAEAIERFQAEAAAA